MRVLLVGLCLATAAGALHAQNLLVTRKTADVYSVSGDDLLLLTRDCEVHALAQPASLESDAGRMVLRFDRTLDGRCALRDMLKPRPFPSGVYQLSLTLDTDDWYRIDGSTLQLRTIGCQRLAKQEPAVWHAAADGSGRVEFRSGNGCLSDGAFRSVRRQGRAKER